MARPTKFNKERAIKIIDLVRKGNFKTTAARAAGVDIHTLDRWIKAGKEGKNKELREFCSALEEAEADAELTAVSKISTKMNDSSIPAILDYMRRRFPDWNVTDKAEIKQEIKEDVDTIDARVNEYFAERAKRGLLLRDDSEESIHTDNADSETSDSTEK